VRTEPPCLARSPPIDKVIRQPTIKMGDVLDEAHASGRLIGLQTTLWYHAAALVLLPATEHIVGHISTMQGYTLRHLLLASRVKGYMTTMCCTSEGMSSCSAILRSISCTGSRSSKNGSSSMNIRTTSALDNLLSLDRIDDTHIRSSYVRRFCATVS